MPYHNPQKSELTIYFISGLGVDKRVFQKLKLPSDYSIKHLEWLRPIENEPLADYARRFSNAIDTSSPFVLIGLSFGGIIATEISKFLDPKLTILISSYPICDQMPGYFRPIAYLHLDQIIPAFLLKYPNPLTSFLFGARNSETRKLLADILKDTDKQFLKWAIRKILTWTNSTRPKNLFHIHGTNDKILPVRYVTADLNIEGGGHLMVFDMADKVSQIITDKLRSI